MDGMVCPKCNLEQPRAEECRGCGIIIARYKPYPERSETQSEFFSQERAASPFWEWFRILRWAGLTAALLALFLVFWGASPPPTAVDPGAAGRVEEKILETRRAIEAGQPHTMSLDEAEVNTWIGRNLDIASEPPAPALPEALGQEASYEEVRRSVKDLQVKLDGDQVQAYLVFDFYGKDMTLTVTGTVMVRDGYLRLEPTSGRLGSLPIPVTALRQAVDKAFSDPDNREKLRLPDHIQNLAVTNGRLVVVYR